MRNDEVPGPLLREDAAALSPAEARTLAHVRPNAIGSGRARAAAAFDAIVRGRTERRDFSASNCALAIGFGVAEKQIRQYRTGDKTLPFGAVYCLPPSIALELLDAARAAVRPAASIRRSSESHVRRLTKLVGEMNAELESGMSSPSPRSRALQLTALALVAEAEELVRHLTLTEENK